jgi:phosphoketolase
LSSAVKSDLIEADVSKTRGEAMSATITLPAELEQALARKAAAEGVDVERYAMDALRRVAEMPTISELSDGAQIQEENSSHATPDFGAYLLEKHNKEQRRFLALQKMAAQQGVTAAEWVRQHFPNGRDSLGRSLAEFLDSLSFDTASTSQ